MESLCVLAEFLLTTPTGSGGDYLCYREHSITPLITITSGNCIRYFPISHHQRMPQRVENGLFLVGSIMVQFPPIRIANLFISANLGLNIIELN